MDGSFVSDPRMIDAYSEWPAGTCLLTVTIAAMSDDRKSSKIYIPHTGDEGCNIVGILEQLEAGGDTQGRPIALVRLSSHCLSMYRD